MTGQELYCFCGHRRYRWAGVFRKPPVGEPLYAALKGVPYRREIWRCRECGHYRAVHSLPLRHLYEGDYADAGHGGDRMAEQFRKILSLPSASSDNAGRVRRVIDFARDLGLPRFPSALDVGSGLCVFLAELKKSGWRCTALDPDPRAALHAKRLAGVTAHCGIFEGWNCERTFDVITFNKVLEHAAEPIRMLRQARALLKPGGFLYVEVPDGETAGREGLHREEFFVDHWHIFSAASLALLACRAYFGIQFLRKIREPSGKFTLYAFMTPTRDPSGPDIGSKSGRSR